MSKERLELEALVLRVFDWSESSQTARLLTKDHGRLSVIAKGILKPNGYLLGPMDLFQWSEATVLFDPKNDLHLLVRYRVITGFPGLRQSYEAFCAACQLIEIADLSSRNAHPAGGLFGDLWQALRRLESDAELVQDLLVAWFGFACLRAEGVLPHFATCVGCWREAPPSKAARFAPARGGLLCQSCAAEDPLAALWTLSGALRGLLLRLLAADSPAALAGAIPRAPRDLAARLRKLSLALIEGLFERELKAKHHFDAPIL